MRELSLPETGSKRKLYDAAEQLFADKGFEAVSVRDITQLAQTNVASVNYHFGSREGLLTLVMMRYIMPVTDERLLRLEQAERKYPGKNVPLEEIIDAFVRPLVTQVRKSELSEKLFFKLLGRIFSQHCDGLPPAIEEQFRTIVDRFTRSIAKALPTVPIEDLVWRFHFMAGSMIHMLTHQEVIHRVSGGASGSPTMDTTISRFIKFAAAGLSEGVQADGEEEIKKGPQGMLFDF